MAVQITQVIGKLLGLVPDMAGKAYEAFLRLFTNPSYVMTGTTSFGYVYDGQSGLNALGIFAVCSVGLGMVIGIVHFAQKLFGRSR